MAVTVRRYTDEELFDVADELPGADLSGRDLHRVAFAGFLLDGTLMTACDLRNADLRGASAVGAVFDRSKLVEARLCGAYLNRASFQEALMIGADLSGVSLRSALLIGADLRDARLRGADIRGADFTGARLDGADLEGVLLDETTKGLLRPGDATEQRASSTTTPR